MLQFGTRRLGGKHYIQTKYVQPARKMWKTKVAGLLRYENSDEHCNIVTL